MPDIAKILSKEWFSSISTNTFLILGWVLFIYLQPREEFESVQAYHLKQASDSGQRNRLATGKAAGTGPAAYFESWLRHGSHRRQYSQDFFGVLPFTASAAAWSMAAAESNDY